MQYKKEKIGLAVITCNRPSFFRECIQSIPKLDEVVVVNDGEPYDEKMYTQNVTKIIQNNHNSGIAYSKNAALKYMLDKNCEHLFLCEDDIALMDPEVIYRYIKASKVSGIYHLNYGYHGKWNRTPDGVPTSRWIMKYNDEVSVVFNRELTGAFSYFRRQAIIDTGFFDEFYKNILEHVDHTFQIIKKGFHPPLYWYADIEKSFNFIKELDPNLSKSLNTRSSLNYWFRIKYFTLYFIIKNRKKPHKFPDASRDELTKILENMRYKRGIING